MTDEQLRRLSPSHPAEAPAVTPEQLAAALELVLANRERAERRRVMLRNWLAECGHVNVPERW